MTRSLSVFALVLFSFSAFAETVVDAVRRFDRLTIDSTSKRLNGSFTTGRLRINFADGHATRVRAGEEQAGIYFQGNGTFTYTVDDPIEFSVVRTNLRNTKSRATVGSADKALTVTAPFTELLWIAGGAPVPELTGDAGPSLEGDFAAHLATSRLQIGTDRAIRFAARALNAPNNATVRIDMRGAEEWVYRRDEATDHFESLEKLYTLEFEDRSRRTERYAATIANEPLGRDRLKAPVVAAVMTHIDYDITAADQSVAMTVRETITPTASGHRAFWFGLDDTKYDSRDRRWTLDVKKVTAADGTALPFVQVNHQVLVGLPTPTVAGKPVQVTFELAGDVLLRPSGDNYWMLRGAWYPSFDLAGEAFTAKGTVKVKEPFIPFAGGRTISRRSENGFNIVETAIETPVGFLCVIAGKYHSEETKRDKLTIRTASYAQKNPQAIKKITALAYDIIGYYEYFLGPFPVDELNILEINDFGWGQAPTGLIFITSEAFQPLLGTVNQLYSEGINERIAHEIAHQYWGTAVRMPSFEEQWLTESFAEYSAALFLKKAQGDAVYKRLVSHWRGNAKIAHEQAPIPLANRLVAPNNPEYNRTHLLYSKGPLLLSALHKDVGDDVFLTFLKSYQKSFRNKFGSTKDVAGLLSFMTKKDYKAFFDTHYWGTGLPN